MRRVNRKSKKRTGNRKKTTRIRKSTIPILSERQKHIQEILHHKELTKKTCPHLRTNDDRTYQQKGSNIKWMEHSNGIIMGVCGTCFSQFDTRNPEDLAIFNALSLMDYSIQEMAKARVPKEAVFAAAPTISHRYQPLPPYTDIVLKKKPSLWQRFLSLFN